MTTEQKLYARAILLEQYENGVDVEKAIERLRAEIGPHAMEMVEAIDWYGRFKSGNLEISDGASRREQALIESGTYLRFQRSIRCKFNGYPACTFHNVHETDERFSVSYRFSNQFFVMDTLHGIEKEIKFDWTEIASERINKICTLNICFLNGENVCGTIVHRPSSLHGGNLTLFVGTFNFVDCVLKLKRTKEHEGSLLLMKFTANPPSIFFFNNMIRYATINIESLSLENVIPLPRGLGLPIIRNGNLCGFDHPDAKKMIKISLTDGTTKEHAIAEKDRVNIKHRTKPISVSMGNKFLFGLDDCSNETSTVFEFDLTTLKFTKTGIQTSGYSTQFATNDHLMLYTCKNFEDEYLDNDHYKWIVSRFQFGKVSPLANLTWEAMRRYSRFNPEFYVWFMSKLSVNSKFRPIW